MQPERPYSCEVGELWLLGTAKIQSCLRTRTWAPYLLGSPLLQYDSGWPWLSRGLQLVPGRGPYERQMHPVHLFRSLPQQAFPPLSAVPVHLQEHESSHRSRFTRVTISIALPCPFSQLKCVCSKWGREQGSQQSLWAVQCTLCSFSCNNWKEGTGLF